ncbi:hypothetical protein DRN76_04785 [Methanosarcinales archaeon]|nr:MAG: hypothetical protein DRN76_04785 [Methanosarcinales archaeon]
MQTDFDDLRVKYYNGAEWVFIPYWVEKKVDGEWCKLWFNATSIPANSWCNDSYRLYYGDDTATSESNSNNVLVLFEDFNDDDAEWDYSGSGHEHSLSSSNAHSPPESAYLKYNIGGCAEGYLYRTIDLPNSDIIMEFWDRVYVDAWGAPIGIKFNDTWIKEYSRGTSHGWTKQGIDISSYKDSTIVFKIYHKDTSGHCSIEDHDANINIDDIKIRKYTSPEPTTKLGPAIPLVTVSGYVKTFLGVPIENAFVTSNVTTSDTDYTDTSGFYNLNLSGYYTYKITATKEGFVPKSIVVSVSDTNITNANITLGTPGSEEIEPLYISIEEVGEGYVKINASWSGFAALEDAYYFVFCGISYGDIKKKKADGNGILTIEETLHSLFIEGEEYCCKAAAYKGDSKGAPLPTSTPTLPPGVSYVDHGGIFYGSYTDEACFTAIANETLKQTNYGSYIDDLTDISTELNVTLWASILSEPYKERMGLSFFGILFILPFIAMWIRGTNTIIPSLLGLILGGFIWAYMPEKFVHMAYLFIIISIAGVVYGIFRQKV